MKPKPLRRKKQPRQIETLAKRSTMSCQHKCSVTVIFESEKEAGEFQDAVNAAKVKRS